MNSLSAKVEFQCSAQRVSVHCLAEGAPAVERAARSLLPALKQADLGDTRLSATVSIATITGSRFSCAAATPPGFELELELRNL